MNGRKWTKKEDDLLRKLYSRTSNPDLAKKMNRTSTMISSRAFLLGLKKDKVFLRKMGIKLQNSGLSHRFKKGSEPWNKGTKGIMKPNRTSFKKGNLPKNTKPIGSVVKVFDGYLKVKVADPDVWEFKHQLVWKEHHGPIPDGCNVQFKNKNRSDCRIENLYLISREEQMKENTIHKYPEELKKIIRIQGKLKRTIIKKESKNEC